MREPGGERPDDLRRRHFAAFPAVCARPQRREVVATDRLGLGAQVRNDNCPIARIIPEVLCGQFQRSLGGFCSIHRDGHRACYSLAWT